jgi:hypothetical protein
VISQLIKVSVATCDNKDYQVLSMGAAFTKKCVTAHRVEWTRLEDENLRNQHDVGNYAKMRPVLIPQKRVSGSE